jgi:hypothetical protein
MTYYTAGKPSKIEENNTYVFKLQSYRQAHCAHMREDTRVNEYAHKCSIMCNTTWIFKPSVVLSFRKEPHCMFCSSDTPTTYCLGYPLHTDVGEVIA